MNVIKDKLVESGLFSSAVIQSIYEMIIENFKDSKEVQIILQKQSATENAFMLMIKDAETNKKFVAIGEDLEQSEKENVNMKIIL